MDQPADTAECLTPILSEEVVPALDAVIAEIKAGLEPDLWQLDWANQRMQADLMTAAAMRHCQVLASEILLAVERGADMTVKILGRSFVETWITGMYMHHGGYAAVEAVVGSYERGVRSAQSLAEETDRQLAERVRHAKKSNEKLKKVNDGISIHNVRHPDRPKPFEEYVPMPLDVPLQLDLSAVIAEFEMGEDLAPLKVYEMVDRIRRLTLEAGAEQNYESTYNYAYRTLSWTGAHATSQVIGSYIEGDGHSKTVTSSSRLPDLNEAVQTTTLLLLAVLVEEVFGRRGIDHTASTIATARFEQARQQQPHSTRSDRIS